MLTESAKSIKILRIRTGLSQSEFAKRFHFGMRGLQAWEQGRTEPPEHIMYLLPLVLDLESRSAGLKEKLDERTASEARLKSEVRKLKSELRERDAAERALKSRIDELERAVGPVPGCGVKGQGDVVV